MSLRDQPYLPLYVQDFLTDEKLAECSASSQGVYIRIMCLMHKQEAYGRIEIKQKYKQTASKILAKEEGDEVLILACAAMLVKQTPFSCETIQEALNELLREGVLYIQDDFLCQKRMIKDGEVSLMRAASGGLGGKQKAKQNASKMSSKPVANTLAKGVANTENENENESSSINISNSDKSTTLYEGGMGETKLPDTGKQEIIAGLKTKIDSIQGKGKPKEETWRTDYEIYLHECRNGFKEAYADKEFLRKQQKFWPEKNLVKIMDEAFHNFWGTQAGWAKKKAGRGVALDWRRTIVNCFKFGKIYYSREEMLKMA